MIKISITCPNCESNPDLEDSKTNETECIWETFDPSTRDMRCPLCGRHYTIYALEYCLNSKADYVD